MIILDWTRPGGMAKELIGWLNWIEDWCYDSKDSEEMRSNCGSYLPYMFSYRSLIALKLRS